MTPTYTAGDVLAYTAARVAMTTSWAADSIVGHPGLPDAVVTDFEDVAYSLGVLSGQLQALAIEYGHTSGVYSDGRPTMTGATLAPGYGYSHLWHFDPDRDVRRTIEPAPYNGARVVVHIVPPSVLRVENVATSAVVREAHGPAGDS